MQRTFLWVFLLASCLAAQAGALPTAVMHLDGPTYNGSLASLPVSLSFTDDPQDNETTLAVSYFSLDVSNSSSELTAGGTDFSAFSFNLSPALAPNWSLLADFNDGILLGTVEYQSFVGLTPPLNNLSLGNLVVDLSGLPAGLPLAVAIDGLETLVGYDFEAVLPAATTNNFYFIPPTFDPSSQDLVVPQGNVVPEPTTAVLSVLGLAAASLAMCRRR